MRDFRAMPLPGPDGEFVAAVPEDGASHLLTVSPGGVQMEPVQNAADPLSKNEMKASRIRGSRPVLRAAGR